MMDNKRNDSLTTMQEITLGEFVLLQRRFMGLTQEQLASKSGISRNYLSYIEQDKSSITLAKARKVCKALGYDIVFWKDDEKGDNDG